MSLLVLVMYQRNAAPHYYRNTAVRWSCLSLSFLERCGLSRRNLVCTWFPFYASAGVDDEVLKCMNRVYLRGCESAYLGHFVDKEAICPKRDPHEINGAGSLVIHIRSGDIFEPQEAGHALFRRYGQVLPHPFLYVQTGDIHYLSITWDPM